MSLDLKDILRLGVSTSVVADTRKTDRHFRRYGPRLHRDYMLARKDIPLPPNPHGFNLLMTLTNMSKDLGHDITDHVVISRNSPLTATRGAKVLSDNGIPITSAAFVNMDPDIVTPLQVYDVDFFLTTSKDDAMAATKAGIASCIVTGPKNLKTEFSKRALHLIVDLDQVVFGSEFEELWESNEISEFLTAIAQRKDQRISEGRHAGIVKFLLKLAEKFEDKKINGQPALMISAVTARGSDAIHQALHQLAEMGIDINGQFYAMGGFVKKKGEFNHASTPKIKALRALASKFPDHLPFFLDDSEKNIKAAKDIMACGLVPVVREESAPS